MTTTNQPRRFGINGLLLRELRENAGWTRDQFAEALGISPDYLSNLENQHRRLAKRPDIAKRAADLLGTSVEELRSA